MPPSSPPSNVRDLASIRLTHQDRRVGRETISNLARHAEMEEARDNFVAKDPLVKAISEGRSDPASILKAIREEIAREQAEMHFRRLEAEKRGTRDAKSSKARIDALIRLANIELEIRKLGAEAVDFRSEYFQKVFGLWIEAIRDVAVDLFSPEQVDLFFNRLGTKLDGWEQRAADTLR